MLEPRLSCLRVASAHLHYDPIRKVSGNAPTPKTKEFPLTSQAKVIERDQSTPLRMFWITSLSMILIVAQSLMAQSQESFADLAQKISPSVVNITIIHHRCRPHRPARHCPRSCSPFEDFFREFQDSHRPGRPSAPVVSAGVRLRDPRKTGSSSPTTTSSKARMR